MAAAHPHPHPHGLHPHFPFTVPHLPPVHTRSGATRPCHLLLGHAGPGLSNSWGPPWAPVRAGGPTPSAPLGWGSRPAQAPPPPSQVSLPCNRSFPACRGGRAHSPVYRPGEAKAADGPWTPLACPRHSPDSDNAVYASAHGRGAAGFTETGELPGPREGRLPVRPLPGLAPGCDRPPPGLLPPPDPRLPASLPGSLLPAFLPQDLTVLCSRSHRPHGGPSLRLPWELPAHKPASSPHVVPLELRACWQPAAHTSPWTCPGRAPGAPR